MPIPTGNWEDDQVNGNYLLQRELAYDLVDLNLVQNNEGKIFFLQSAGGGGKTYVCNTIAAAVRAINHPALCVASSGIAALLLDGGHTAHSCFKIPIPIFDTSFCNIGQNPQLKELIKLTKVIIWDEALMQHHHAIEALDQTLQDILDQELPFGGLTVLIGGDSRQILPVIPRGSQEQIINASIFKSRLWAHIPCLSLNPKHAAPLIPRNCCFCTISLRSW